MHCAFISTTFSMVFTYDESICFTFSITFSSLTTPFHFCTTYGCLIYSCFILCCARAFTDCIRNVYNSLYKAMFISDYVTSIYLLCYQLEMNKLPSSCESSTLRLCYTCNNFCAWPNSKRLKCL